MQKRKNKLNVIKVESLYVSCFDFIQVVDKTTFDSCVVNGIDITFWWEENGDTQKILNGMFDLLFEDVVKARKIIGN